MGVRFGLRWQSRQTIGPCRRTSVVNDGSSLDATNFAFLMLAIDEEVEK